jgi:hypothetical protein
MAQSFSSLQRFLGSVMQYMYYISPAMSTGNFIHLLLEPCFCLNDVFFCDGDGHAVNDDMDKLESVWALG